MVRWEIALKDLSIPSNKICQNRFFKVKAAQFLRHTADIAYLKHLTGVMVVASI